MKVTIFLILISGCFFLYMQQCEANGMSTVRDKAVNTAKEEAIKLGYDITKMTMSVHEYTQPWNECIPREPETEYEKQRYKKLVGRTYLMIYFSPDFENTRLVGGDYCIFIDAKTGEIITDVRGK